MFVLASFAAEKPRASFLAVLLTWSIVSCFFFLHLRTKEAQQNLDPGQLYQVLPATLLKYEDDVSRPATTSFVCVAWVATDKCDPNGPVRRRFSCDTKVAEPQSGFCELLNLKTNQIHRVMKTHCRSFWRGVTRSCADVAMHFTQWGKQSLDFLYHPPTIPMTLLPHNTTYTVPQNGIVMCIYDKVIYGAYAAIRTIREHGCKLPIEVWFKSGELFFDDPILHELVYQYGVRIRVIHERENINGFETKPYALYHSAFQNVLLLDADNVPVRDPTYLFESQEFKQMGAIFWPDYWQASNTHFNINRKNLLWELLDIPYVDMFEQESGQVLVNKATCKRALEVLMFYNLHKPALMSTLKLAWGDKDLFRFAWLKTKTSFHMIKRPPGTAGLYDEKKRLFCGATMVQYDPMNRIIFLHRNFGKLDGTRNQPKIWKYLQEFNLQKDVSEYRYVDISDGDEFDRKECWGFYDYGKHVDASRNSPLMYVSKSNFSKLEDRLLHLSRIARSKIVY